MFLFKIVFYMNQQHIILEKNVKNTFLLTFFPSFIDYDYWYCYKIFLFFS